MGFMPPSWGSDENNDPFGWYEDQDKYNDNDNSYGGNDNGYGDNDYRDDDDYWDDRDDSSGKTDQDGSQSQGKSSTASIGILISDNNGVYISQVTGDNAKKAGFREGDKVVSFDGTDISDCNSLIAEVQKHKSGDKVKVVVERNGKEVKIKTTLE